MICDDTFFIKISQSIFNEKFKILSQIAEDKGIFKIEKRYQSFDRVKNSLSY